MPKYPLIPKSIYDEAFKAANSNTVNRFVTEYLADFKPKRKIIISTPRKSGKSYLRKAIEDAFKPKKTKKKCSSCGRKGAVMYNPWNMVTQCHHCGEIVPDFNEKEKVIFS